MTKELNCTLTDTFPNTTINHNRSTITSPIPSLYNDNADERLTQAVEDLRAKLVAAHTAQSDLQSKLANVSTEAQTAERKTEALTVELKQGKDEVATKIEAITTLEEQIVALTEEKDTFEAKLAESEKKLNETLARIEEETAAASLLTRKSALIEAGAAEEEVNELLASFADTSDEMFEQVVVLVKKGFVPLRTEDDDVVLEEVNKAAFEVAAPAAEEPQAAQDLPSLTDLVEAPAAEPVETPAPAAQPVAAEDAWAAPSEQPKVTDDDDDLDAHFIS
jgi:chromosome segregation ATPase